MPKHAGLKLENAPKRLFWQCINPACGATRDAVSGAIEGWGWVGGAAMHQCKDARGGMSHASLGIYTQYLRELMDDIIQLDIRHVDTGYRDT